MTSVVFSVLLLLQAAAPAPVKVVSGRLTVEGGAQVPSSFDLPLTAVGGVTTPTRTVIIRLQIDGSFQAQLPTGEYRVGAPGRLPPGYTLQSMVYGGVDLLRNPLKIASNDSAELDCGNPLEDKSPLLSKRMSAPTAHLLSRRFFPAITSFTSGCVLRRGLRWVTRT
jgi:hypothetical protein